MVPVSGGLDMLELCQAGKLESMALRDGGMIIEACDVTNSTSCVNRIKCNMFNLENGYLRAVSSLTYFTFWQYMQYFKYPTNETCL